MTEVVIVEGVRTPIGNFGGALRDVPIDELGAVVTKELLARTHLDPRLVNEVVFGCVGQYSNATNVARVIGLRAGLPVQTPAFTVQQNCASGMQALVTASQEIACGDAEVVVAGGTENMSQAPYVSRTQRWGSRLRNTPLIDSIWEGLTDGFCGQVMGVTAENLAEEFRISREAQDEFAVQSHQRAFRAQREGRFKDEIVTVMVPKKVPGRPPAAEPFAQDEGPNAGLAVQQLALYPPIFKESGTVTAGNACPLNDGAAAVLMMSRERAKALSPGIVPLGTIRGYAFVGVEPQRMGIGPAEAIPLAVKRAGLSLTDIQLFEISEAFAAQYLAVEKKLGLNREVVNVNGGYIALGHPVGMSGVRLVIALLRELKRRNLTRGVAAVCVGGGLGAAIVVERR